MAKDFNDFLELLNSADVQHEENELLRMNLAAFSEDGEHVTLDQKIAGTFAAANAISISRLERYHQWMAE